MRTTLTIDEDIMEKLKESAHRRGVPFKRVVNEALRSGIVFETRPREIASVEVVPFSLGLKSGIDPDRLNQLADDLEAESYAESLAKSERP
ncbi:MAG: DUF2191 domain-containing protein [Opitutaceae bacterium]|nr:DUF2191 domain-containing protein [Opitutaceae bacterium]